MTLVVPTYNGNVVGGTISGTWSGAFSGATTGNFSGALTAADFIGKLDPKIDLSGLGLYNVLFYGAKGDGTTDDTADIGAAYTACPAGGTLFFPAINASGVAANYKVTAQTTIAKNIEILGLGTGAGGSPTITQTFNGSAFLLQAECVISGISFVGTGTASNTSERAVTISGINQVSLRHCTFSNHYDSCYTDTSSTAAFYNTFESCTWLSATNSFIRTAGSASSGADLILTGANRMLCGQTSASNYPNYGMLLDNLGSIICTGLQMSPPNFVITGVKFSTFASAYGGAAFANCVFEGANASASAAAWVAGTSGAHGRLMYFNNCDFGSSNTTVESFRVDYGNNMYFTGCQFGAGVGIGFHNYARNISLDACDFECANSCVYAYAGAQVTFVSITDPQYSGSAAFLNLGALGGVGIGANEHWGVSIRGGQTGTATNSTKYQFFANGNTTIDVPDPSAVSLFGGVQYGSSVFSGDGSTTEFDITHALGYTPGEYNVTPQQAAAVAHPFYVTATSTVLKVIFTTAPSAGTNNLSFAWRAKLL